MKTLNYISLSPENTILFAKTIAKNLKNSDIIVLSGELGAGKTKFTEGILTYFGLQDEISSPTFNIVNEYIGNGINIYHFDVYRLEDVDEFYGFGGEEYFEKGICLIEWGETILEALPEEYLQINFEKDSSDENKRILNILAIGEKYEKLLDSLKEDLI